MARSFRIRETGSHIPGMPSNTKGNMIFTPQQVEAIDREENRIRVSGSEQEAMMAVIAAGNLFTQAVPMLEALARHAGVLPRLRQSLTIMRKSIIAMNMHIATGRWARSPVRWRTARSPSARTPPPPTSTSPWRICCTSATGQWNSATCAAPAPARKASNASCAGGAGAGAWCQGSGQGDRPEGRDTVPVQGHGDGGGFLMADVRLIDENTFINKKDAMYEIKALAKEIARQNGGVDDITLYLKEAYDRIATLPTIDAVPVVHGRWVHDINNLYCCSVCLGRESMSHKKLKKYCPNCGAKMDAKDIDVPTKDGGAEC